MAAQFDGGVYQQWFEYVPEAMVVVDEGGVILAINERGQRLFGDKLSVGMKIIEELVPEEQRGEMGYFLDRIRYGEQGDRQAQSYEWRWQKERLVARVIRCRGARVAGSAGVQVLLIIEDVTRMEEEAEITRRREEIFEALILAAGHFLLATPDVWEQNVLQVLEQIGKARNSDRVYLCKNIREDGEVTGTMLRYEWKATGERAVFRKGEVEAKRYEEVGLSRWAKLLSRGDTLCEEAALLPDEERQWNMAPEAKAIVVVPIFVWEEWWGYMVLEEWQQGRECSRQELEALKAMAITFGTAIRKKRAEEALEWEKQNVERKVAARTRELKEKTGALEKARGEVSKGLVRQQQEKARLTASIHSLSLGFVMTDINGEILLFNHAVNDILGPETQGWTWERLRERLAGVFDLQGYFQRCLEEKEEFDVDDVEYRQQFLRIYLTPIKMIEGDGEVIGMVMLLEDITEEKKLQQTRDEFFAVASHELRTPLSSIRGNSSVIQDYFREKVGDEMLMGIVDDIYNSSVRLIDIVNEYLDISRAELNKIEMKKEGFDMVAEAAKVVEELQANAQEKGLELVFQVDRGKQVWADADKDRTRQVLFNLIGNGLKYTDTGGVYVQVAEEDRRVVVRVYDTGEGIKEAERSMLFEKFKQFGDRVYKRDAAQGTGMGLYISRLIIEAMGGEVYLQSSQVGKGSCFTFELPKA